jgi:Leucine-rich repeat (LRR) protein
MDTYYQKYLKYKSKYINLKRDLDTGFLNKNYDDSFVNKTTYFNLKNSNKQNGGSYYQRGGLSPIVQNKLDEAIRTGAIKLELVSNYFLSDNDAVDIARALAGNTTLQTIDLTNNRIGDEGAIALAGNTTLQTLDLTNNRIGYEGARALADNKTLQTLNLDSNEIGDEGAIALAGNTTLQTLNLSDNKIGDEGARVLANNTTLQTLNLAYNKIGEIALAALAGNTTLQTLNLLGHRIGDEGAIALAGNTTLQTLNLPFNEIGDEGARALAGNRTLQNLDLYGNEIRDEGAIALADSLKGDNTNLQNLSLPGGVDEKIIREIDFYLKRNRELAAVRITKPARRSVHPSATTATDDDEPSGDASRGGFSIPFLPTSPN